MYIGIVSTRRLYTLIKNGERDIDESYYRKLIANSNSICKCCKCILLPYNTIETIYSVIFDNDVYKRCKCCLREIVAVIAEDVNYLYKIFTKYHEHVGIRYVSIGDIIARKLHENGYLNWFIFNNDDMVDTHCHIDNPGLLYCIKNSNYITRNQFDGDYIFDNIGKLVRNLYRIV